MSSDYKVSLARLSHRAFKVSFSLSFFLSPRLPGQSQLANFLQEGDRGEPVQEGLGQQGRAQDSQVSNHERWRRSPEFNQISLFLFQAGRDPSLSGGCSAERRGSHRGKVPLRDEGAQEVTFFGLCACVFLTSRLSGRMLMEDYKISPEIVADCGPDIKVRERLPQHIYTIKIVHSTFPEP